MGIKKIPLRYIWTDGSEIESEFPQSPEQNKSNRIFYGAENCMVMGEMCQAKYSRSRKSKLPQGSWSCVEQQLNTRWENKHMSEDTAGYVTDHT